MHDNEVAGTIRFSRFRKVAFSLALGLTVGCGGSTSTTGATGGAGGAGGEDSGGGAGAAGTTHDGGPRDGPSPPLAQGAVSLHMMEGAGTLLRCSPGRQWVNAPSTPTPIQVQGISGAEVETRAVDGAEGTEVTCAVQKSGDKFVFSADITTPRTDGTHVLHPTILHFDASGISPTGPVAKGTVTMMTDTTGANFADDQCSFSVTPQGGATDLDIQPGKVWASVTCEHLAHPTEPDAVCLIDVGFVVFENCAQ